MHTAVSSDSSVLATENDGEEEEEGTRESNQNGKVETAKEIVEEVDDELHKIVFKVIEGGVLEVYNPLILTVNIEDMGHNKLVIWTMDFEKVNG
ncbi:unnamed protein product [Lactuca virosa]|uniref:Bet v I/Major latex protein domain-containing protein n=1 Tax=Lactuca virosa TaxID=75947 RepID=A0AAU9LIF8_9ASTR|nr:unnamed protein product [Lactuca virosa]